MTRTIDVFVGADATRVGRLYYNRRGSRESSALEYDDAWLANEIRFPIDPATQLVKGPQYPQRTSASVFHSAIGDTEPDGWAKNIIMRDHVKRRERGEDLEPLDALSYLLAVDDLARVGALRLRDENGVFQRAAGQGRRTPPRIELPDLLAATRAVENNRESASDLEYLRGRGTSLGGQRPKCTISDDGRLAIGKFPSVQDTRPVPAGEVLALQLARSAGIDAATAELVDAGGSPVAVIRRFDRTNDGGRLMYISAATLLGVDPRKEHAYTAIVDGIRQHGADAAADIAELWRRIAFSILITNVDDHLMNHGFLHTERGLWRLAPAFDINPFPDRARELKVWISESAGPAATIKGLMSVVPYFGISMKKARSILAEVENAVSEWRAHGSRLMTSDELELYAPAFEHRERQAARDATR
jgi:serine/threonine-protein kinase HipA